MRNIPGTLLFLLGCALPWRVQASSGAIEIYGKACERIVNGESKSSARVRAADKAAFLGVKRVDGLEEAKKILNEHDLNVMVYRLVDEYLEDMSAATVTDEEGKICVEVKGRLNPEYIKQAGAEFIHDSRPANEASPEVVSEVAAEVRKQVSIMPDNPESLALLHVRKLEFFNGARSEKFAAILKEMYKNNPYFYLTEDAEIADYVIAPKVLKAKVDKLDAGHKRLQMVVSLEISGLEKEVVSEYQNRFVLFGSEDDEQKTALRLIRKLIEQAGDGARRKIEHNEQLKLEKKTLGRTLSE